LTLPIAPVDRIARLDIDDRFRVAEDARFVLGEILEAFATEAAEGASILAEHAGRRTIQAEDIETYFRLVE
jgi:histone H3/H4